MSNSIIGFSDYLQSRRFNSTLLNRIGEEISPVIEQFNEANDRQVKVEWCMSAKYQTGTLSVKMEDGDELSDAVKWWIEESLSPALEEWFDYMFDYDDVRDTYASLDVGF